MSDGGPRAGQIELVQGKLAAAIINVEIALTSALDPQVQERLRRALEAAWAASASLSGDSVARRAGIRIGAEDSALAAPLAARGAAARSKLAAAIIQLELACVMYGPSDSGRTRVEAALDAAWAGAELLADLPIGSGVHL